MIAAVVGAASLSANPVAHRPPGSGLRRPGVGPAPYTWALLSLWRRSRRGVNLCSRASLAPEARFGWPSWLVIGLFVWLSFQRGRGLRPGGLHGTLPDDRTATDCFDLVRS